jgi:hypothetical protein
MWLHIDMNVAPVSADAIYDWLYREIIAGCQATMPDLDFDDLDVMKRVYSVEVNKFIKGRGKLFAGHKDQFNQELSARLEKLENNLHDQSIAYTRFFSTERGKLLIIVLDNCDKRNRDEQLLMFQAAQWMQREFRGLVILPLREETYDNHRDQPPLDTALKDLVFRIEPALFHHVLVKRVQLALNTIHTGQGKVGRFELPNGFHVQYCASNQAYFLSSIVRSIFVHDYQIRRLIVGLAGRDIRRALEIFLEFCASGHIGEDEIVRIIQSEGQHILPLSLVVRILVRMNKRFYDDECSFVKNVFAADPNDTKLDYFVRLMILRWLHEHYEKSGPAGLKGYFPIRDICAALNTCGVDADIVSREIEHLVQGRCILSEDLRTSSLAEDESIKLAPAGFVHLELLSNLNYLAAVAEDTWFAKSDTASVIAERIKTIADQFSETTVAHNARDLLSYLSAERDTRGTLTATMFEDGLYDRLTDLSDGLEALEEQGRSNPWLFCVERYRPGSVFQ